MPYTEVSSDQTFEQLLSLRNIFKMLIPTQEKLLKDSTPNVGSIMRNMPYFKQLRISEIIKQWSGRMFYFQGCKQHGKYQLAHYSIESIDLQNELKTDMLYLDRSDYILVNLKLYNVQVYQKEEPLSGYCRTKPLVVAKRIYNPMPAMAGFDVGNENKILDSLLALAEESAEYEGWEVFEIDQVIRDMYAPVVESEMTLLEFWNNFDFHNNHVIQVTTSFLPRNKYPERLQVKNVTELNKALRDIAIDQRWDMRTMHVLPTARRKDGFQCRVLPMNVRYSDIKNKKSIGNGWFKSNGISEHLRVKVLYSCPLL